MTVTVNQVFYRNGDEMLRLTTARVLGEELVSGVAVRRGMAWRLEPSSETWEETDETVSHDWMVDQRLNSPMDLTDLTDEELAMATVEVSESEMDGRSFHLVRLSWGLPMVAPLIGDQMAELSEGQMRLVYWIDESGFTHRLDMDLFAIDQADPGSRFDLTGRVLFTPLVGPISFPDEILRSELEARPKAPTCTWPTGWRGKC